MSATETTTFLDGGDFWTLLGRSDARDAVSVPRALPGNGGTLALNSVVLSLQMAATEGDGAIVAYVRGFLEEEPSVPSIAQLVDEAPVPLVPTEAAERRRAAAAYVAARLHELDPQIANPELLMERVFEEGRS